jgi:hypothetical protein
VKHSPPELAATEVRRDDEHAADPDRAGGKAEHPVGDKQADENVENKPPGGPGGHERKGRTGMSDEDQVDDTTSQSEDDERDNREEIERTGEPKRDRLGNADGAS